MSDPFPPTGPTAEQWMAFQRIWTETFTKMLHLGATATPESAPPEFLRQLRSGIFEALAQSWDQFLRSPQFLESLKQWMDQAVAFRTMSTDFLTRMHHETQSPAREDTDAVLLAVRHLETRLLGRLETLERQVAALAPAAAGRPASKGGSVSNPAGARSGRSAGARGKRRTRS